MPEEFDPAWEYYAADTEVDEAVHGGHPRRFSTPDGWGVCDRRGYRRTWWGKSPVIGGVDLPRGICGLCGRRYDRRNPASRYCSGVCYWESRVKPPATVACECGKEFTTKTGRKYCSPGCIPLPPQCRRVLPDQIGCRNCGTEFRPRNSRTRFCSHDCGVSGNGGRNNLARRRCLHCSQEFQPKRGDRVYCSHRCSALRWHEEHRRHRLHLLQKG